MQRKTLLVALLMSLFFMTAVNTWALTGGPDSYGYTFFDSQEARSEPFEWVEIDGTGTELSLADNQLSTAIPLGFQFTFYGETYSHVHISSNGFLSFNSGTGNGCCQGQPIPSASDSINNIIAAFWDDIDPSG